MKTRIRSYLNLFQVMLGNHKIRFELIIDVQTDISMRFSSTYVTCPCCPYDSLGIKMQYLNLYIKNLRRYFVMEIEV